MEVHNVPEASDTNTFEEKIKSEGRELSSCSLLFGTDIHIME